MAYSSLIRFRASSAVALLLLMYTSCDFSPGMGPARNFCQRTAFTFCTEQPVVTCELIRLQNSPEGAKVLLRVFSLPIR